MSERERERESEMETERVGEGESEAENLLLKTTGKPPTPHTIRTLSAHSPHAKRGGSEEPVAEDNGHVPRRGHRFQHLYGSGFRV